jgi:ATP-dependent Clp protease protease subunit
VNHTGQDIKVIEDAMERDRFLNPDEAKEFGIIDEVAIKRPVTASDDKKSSGKDK